MKVTDKAHEEVVSQMTAVRVAELEAELKVCASVHVCVCVCVCVYARAHLLVCARLCVRTHHGHAHACTYMLAAIRPPPLAA